MFGRIGIFAAVLTASLPVQRAFAQCTTLTNTTMQVGFGAISNPVVAGEAQRAGCAWTFRQGSENGPLLVGVVRNGPNGAVGDWGDPPAAFTIPVVGPVVSNVAGLNQLTFGPSRPPSMTGLFFHPGNTADADVFAVFSPQTAITITRIDLDAEVINSGSNGVLLSVDARIAGVTQPLIAPTLIPFTASGHQTITPSFSPLTLNPGDAIWIRGDNNGSPFFDWCNANLRMTLRGGPVILAVPRSPQGCIGRNVLLSMPVVGSPGLTFQWLRDGMPIANDGHYVGVTTNLLSITAVEAIDEADFSCIVTTPCANTTSLPVAFDVTGSGDMNCDGFVTVGDIGGFVLSLTDPQGYAVAFPACELTNADVSCDGVVSVGDIGPFVVLLTAN
ncbi:MAG: immunoglobulin domain-containing protein [Phycisphaerae bacterium]|nr:immunoglobulin domain-containing protein [Phycisphaerae bacterium]